MCLLIEQDRPNVTVSWMNSDEEQGFHYDLTIEEKTDDGGVEVTYVEVKTSREHDKRLFEISEPQFRWAMQHNFHYHIYRVFGAGFENAHILQIINPVEQWKHKELTLCMVV